MYVDDINGAGGYKRGIRFTWEDNDFPLGYDGFGV